MALTKVKGHIIADDLALGGNPTTSTQSASDNSTKIATTAYVTTAVSNLVDGAPSTLNTLNEIAAALNDDAALNTTLTNSIATKLPLAGGTMTGSIISNSNIKTTGRIEIASAQPRILLDRADGSYSWNIYNGDGTGNFPTSTFNIANNAGTAVITALDNGNVGIGTSSPTADLSVGSTSTSSGDVHLRTTKTAFSITPSNTDAGGILFDLGWVNGGQGPMKFGINGSEKMTIDSSGDVLIGQTSQTGYAFAQKLVVGDGDNNDGITIQSGSTHQGNLAFNHSDGTTAHGRISYQHNSNYMQFFTNNTERMRIDSSGNVGINATAPSEKLEVDGGIKISNSNSRLYFGAEGGTSYRALEGNTSGSLLQVGEGYSNIALQGNVGIGTSSPNFTLGIHKASAGSNYMQITNSDTGSGSGDGFLIGVASDEAATIWNYENTSMNFGTNGTESYRIRPDGGLQFPDNNTFIATSNTAGGTPYEWGSIRRPAGSDGGQLSIRQYSTGGTAANYPAYAGGTSGWDENTGMYFPNTDQVGLTAGGNSGLVCYPSTDARGIEVQDCLSSRANTTSTRAREHFYHFLSQATFSYAHMKTNIPWASTTQMYSIKFHGHEYGAAEPIDVSLVWYNYNPSNSAVNIGSAGTHTATVYGSSDGYTVMRITFTSGYYTAFTVSQYPTAQGCAMFNITASAANSTASHY